MRRDVPTTTAVRRTCSSPDPPSQLLSWTLELPFTAPLSLNHRDHWRVRALKTAEWRKATHLLARAARIPRCDRVSIELFYTPRDDRARDPLNLVASLKACEDGIVDAQVIADDDSRHHTSVMPVITARGPARRSGNRLWLVVTRLA